MLREKQKIGLVFRDSERYMHLKPIDAYLNINQETPPSFDIPDGFLDWVIEKKFTILPDCKSWVILGNTFFQEWAAAWATNDYSPVKWDGNKCYRYGKYRISLHKTGAKMTVWRGRDCGTIIDAHHQSINWLATMQGLKELDVRQIPMPRSVGAVAESLMSRSAVNAQFLPEPVRKLAWQAFKGGRMQALVRGDFTGCAYDISSAYPAAARDLPWSESECKWEESSVFQPGAFYGFADALADIPDLPAGPIGVRIQSSHPQGDQASELELSFPVRQKVRCWLSMPEMQLLQEMGISFNILSGVWGFPNPPKYAPEIKRPLRRLMDMLYDLRRYDPVGAKALSVACVGQLCSTADGGKTWRVANSLWQPVYASHIYAGVRCQIYRKALKAGLENIAAFCIDGLISAYPLKVGQPGLGQWRKESDGQYFIANDYFKDRPGSTLYRDSMKDGVLHLQQEDYIGVLAYMQNPSLELGSSSIVVKTWQ